MDPEEQARLNLPYDLVLRLTHETACSIEERIDEAKRRFSIPSEAQKEEADRQIRVLVVEDNNDAADSLATVLRLWGFHVDIARDGVSGLEMATRDLPDVVLTDLMMPGLDGFELAKQLRALPELRGTLLAAVSAFLDESNGKRAREAGLDRQFTKPPDLVALHELLEKRRVSLQGGYLPASLPPLGGASMNVLIVEDNIDAANSLATILRIWGFETEVTYDAQAALESVDRHVPNVILTDIGLPGMNGFELAEELSSRPAMKDVLLAAITAWGDEASRERGRRVGLHEYFCKPVDLVALRKLLDEQRAA